ncbi:MAG: hypothetical protein ACREJ4_09895, partial [Candidatus Methylomirabilaceae bacterium]
ITVRLAILDQWAMVILPSGVGLTSTWVVGTLPAQLVALLEELPGPLLDLRPLGGQRGLVATI